MNLPECEECRACITECVQAYQPLGREVLGTRLANDREFANDWHRARKLRTEEDVVLGEELFPSIRFKSSPAIGSARNRMLVHEARTGHKVRLVWRQLGDSQLGDK